MTETHSARAHARLAPSAAHRWMECPGSLPLSDGIEDTTSLAAAEGTAAHELSAHCLETGDDPATFLEMWIDIETDDNKKRFVDLDSEPTEKMRFFVVDEEMVESVRLYVDFVNSLVAGDPDNNLLSIEQRLDMTHLHPEIFGTGDASVMAISAKHLHVVDFKYGKGIVVEATNNKQGQLYGTGAVRRHHNHQIERVTIHIVQPRAPHPEGPIRSYDIDLIDLYDFEQDIRDAGARVDDADNSVSARDEKWDHEFLKAGDWCTFCPVPPIDCPARRERAISVAVEEFSDITEELNLTEPSDLSDERLGRILREADQIHAYVKAVQQYAHDQACAGNPPRGFKLVKKRAVRRWTDEGKVVDYLDIMGVSADQTHTDPKLRSPAQLESYFPGKNKDERQAVMLEEGLVVKKSSGFNLVPEDDKRPAVNLGAKSEFEVIEGVE